MAAVAPARSPGVAPTGPPILVCNRPAAPTGPGAIVNEQVAAQIVAAGRLAYVATAAEAAAAAPGATILLRGSARFYQDLLRSLARRTNRPRVVLWHLEPLPPPVGAPFATGLPSLRELVKIALRDDRVTDPRVNLRDLVRHVGVVDVVAATSRAKVETLAEHGIPAVFAPLGAPELVECGCERDIDVLFVGDLRLPRRRRALRRLRRAGLQVATYGDWSQRGLWGEERERVLCRTRVMLNISRHPGNQAGGRLLLGMRHGVVVVSEPIYRPEPFVPGVHYAEAALGEIPDVVRRLLADDEARGELARAARELCLQETEARAVARLLEAVDAA